MTTRLHDLEHETHAQRRGTGTDIRVGCHARREEIPAARAADEVDRATRAIVARAPVVASDVLIPEPQAHEGIDLGIIELEVVIRGHADRDVLPAVAEPRRIP